MNNPYHKPAGHHKPVVDPPPVHSLSVPERFALMMRGVRLETRNPDQIQDTVTLPTNLDYLRAHQYLYYCVFNTAISDHAYDQFGRWSGEDYKGGSDMESSYTPEQKLMATRMLARTQTPFPADYPAA